jgi:hypothetical protein
MLVGNHDVLLSCGTVSSTVYGAAAMRQRSAMIDALIPPSQSWQRNLPLHSSTPTYQVRGDGSYDNMKTILIGKERQ